MAGYEVLQSALEHADLAVAQWLVDEAGCALPAAVVDDRAWDSCAHAAARSPDGLVKVLWLQRKWLQQEGARPGTCDWHSLAAISVGAGHVGLARYVLETFGEGAMPSRMVASAAFSGGIAAVELLLNAGLVDSDTAYSGAANAGNLAVFRWLVHVAGMPTAQFDLFAVVNCWPSDTSAHSRDLLEVVQLLVGEAGCREWDAGEVVALAARRGELALVQYLLQQTPGYRPGWEVLVAAAQGGCEALLEWLVEQHPGCLEGPNADPSPYMHPAKEGDTATLTALRRLGVPWGAGDVVAKAVRCGYSLPALHWLVEHGAPVGSCEAMEEAAAVSAARGTSAKVVAWLRGLAAAAAAAQVTTQ